MFLLEGAPSMLLGFVVLRWLTDKPKDASWLDAASSEWLTRRLAAERAALEESEPTGFWAVVIAVLMDERVWLLGLLSGCGLIRLYGLILWLPLIITSLAQLSDLQLRLLSPVPPALRV